MGNEWEPQGIDIDPLLLVDGVPVFEQSTFLKINKLQNLLTTKLLTTWYFPQ